MSHWQVCRFTVNGVIAYVNTADNGSYYNLSENPVKKAE